MCCAVRVGESYYIRFELLGKFRITAYIRSDLLVLELG